VETLAGYLVKTWRTGRGVSQLELATRMGVSQGYISRLETGSSRPARLTVEMEEELFSTLAVSERRKNLLRAADKVDQLVRSLLSDDLDDVTNRLRLPLQREAGTLVMIALESGHFLTPGERTRVERRLMDVAASNSRADWDDVSVRQQVYYYLIRSAGPFGAEIIGSVYPSEPHKLVRRSIEVASAQRGDTRLLIEETLKRLLDDDEAEESNLAYYLAWTGDRLPLDSRTAYSKLDSSWSGLRLLNKLAKDIQVGSALRPLELLTLDTLLLRKGRGLLKDAFPLESVIGQLTVDGASSAEQEVLRRIRKRLRPAA
jgi:transcriptional regulator with XRE-family HTH domain